jgi:formylglycine-generating enzyme required for sulfatase activity
VSLTVTSSAGSDTESKFRYIQVDADGERSFMLPGNVPFTMVWVEAGAFTMGAYAGEQGSSSSDFPSHEVTFSHGFWIGKYPVTKAQWQAVMNTRMWGDFISGTNDADSPAVNVAWADTQAFVAALNGLTGRTFRLPTEAEWEYACRAGTKTRFYWGDDLGLSLIGDYAWWAGNAASAGEEYAHVVGLKLPNAWGIYDMSGNTWEWCQDWFGPYSSEPVTDPTGPATGTTRVMRGGGWYNPSAEVHRSACHMGQNPEGVYGDYGFRICTSETP